MVSLARTFPEVPASFLLSNSRSIGPNFGTLALKRREMFLKCIQRMDSYLLEGQRKCNDAVLRRSFCKTSLSKILRPINPWFENYSQPARKYSFTVYLTVLLAGSCATDEVERISTSAFGTALGMCFRMRFETASQESL